MARGTGRVEPPFAAYTGEDDFVFVSYSHQDSPVVFGELEYLRRHGVNVWFDEGIDPGTIWRDEIAHRITDCRTFIFFVTPASVRSANCLREVHYALDQSRPVLPVYLEETELPDGLKMGISDRQAILRYEMDGATYRSKLMGALSHEIDIRPPDEAEREAAEPPRARGASLGWLAALVLAIALPVSLWMVLRTDGGGFDAGRLERILSSSVDTHSPALSTDGTMLAYVSGANEDAELYVRRTDGGQSVRLTESAEYESAPAFSPDGKLLAFHRLDADLRLSVWTVPALGGRAERVLRGAASPAWSPDGEKLAVVLDERMLAIVDLATGAVAELERSFFTDSWARDPTWSADGRELIFVRTAGGASGELWTIPVDGGEPALLLEPEPGVTYQQPYTVPGDDEIVFSASIGGATNLWSVRLNGRGLKQLTFGAGPDRRPSVDRDGNVVFHTARWSSVLVRVDLDTGTETRLLTYDPYLWGPDVSPDGGQLAYSQGESDGTWNVWTYDLAEGSTRQVTFGEAPQMRPRYTPDGSHLVYFTWTPPETVRIAAVDGSEDRLIDIEGPNASYPDVAPDRETLVITQRKGDDLGLYTVPLAGGTPERLTTTPGTVAEWSPDGRRLVFASDRSLSAGIYVIDADGGNERLVADDGGWPIWWPDGEHLLVRSMDANGDQYVRKIPLDGGEESRPVDYAFHGANFPLVVSPDASEIYSTNSQHHVSEIWLLTRN